MCLDMISLSHEKKLRPELRLPRLALKKTSRVGEVLDSAARETRPSRRKPPRSDCLAVTE
jgi:hypothetical protein